MEVFKKPPLPPARRAQAGHGKTDEAYPNRKRPATRNPPDINSSLKPPKRRDAPPLIDNCVVPQHLRDTVQQDYFDAIQQKHPVMHGHIAEEVTDERLSAGYQHSAGQDTRLEVLKHKRRTTLARGSNANKPREPIAFATTILYDYGSDDGDGRGVPVPEISESLSAWASERVEKKRKKRVEHIENRKTGRHGISRGISRALKLRLKTEPSAPTNLHTRVTPPANPGRELFEAYCDALDEWHVSMYKHVPGYKDSHAKQQWFRLRHDKWVPLMRVRDCWPAVRLS
ncbi:hypothetical protein H2202_001107 [Exophiala xenobiotica]|nr:hypothetical protein H2202_001107 [Exophiala xenobiotica]KAK5234192.1 hypothetical protein LTR47_004783 [Exophiala xenobiotica]KAK5243560.1 hypothetical protein LTS06_010708 [Exophiala xenobiotica]KAK5325153.1 hypothetical protein LTR93_004630 [Exophiala xenobiotica]KAK5352869.1 hypothetical protein LTR61_003997 [Exophiala xenobiotica]